MVKLKELNKTCKSRFVSHAIPAQTACRILGNRVKPCPLDPVCKPCNKTGVWLFYAAFAGAFTTVFFVVFWFLRITRIQKLIGWAFRFLAPPFKWLAYSLAGLHNFYKNLPF